MPVPLLIVVIAAAAYFAVNAILTALALWDGEFSLGTTMFLIFLGLLAMLWFIVEMAIRRPRIDWNNLPELPSQALAKHPG